MWPGCQREKANPENPASKWCLEHRRSASYERHRRYWQQPRVQALRQRYRHRYYQQQSVQERERIRRRRRRHYRQDPNFRKRRLEKVRRYRWQHPERIRAYHQRLREVSLLFLGRQVKVAPIDGPPIRKDVCADCGRVRQHGQRAFQLHHTRYDAADPLKHTVELCVACHQRRHARARKRAQRRNGP